MSDGAEVNTRKTNPLKADTDGDGLKDGAEVNTYHTDPLDSDSDNDGIVDGTEVSGGTDPNDASDPPSGPRCGNGVVETGEQCDDGNTSNNDGCLATCQTAECIPGQGGCADGNACTTDSCEEGRCVSTNNTASCDDGLACTTNDVCASGVCAGADTCGDGKRCNAETGQCKNVSALKGRWIPAATYPSTLFYGDMTAGMQYTERDGRRSGRRQPRVDARVCRHDEQLLQWRQRRPDRIYGQSRRGWRVVSVGASLLSEHGWDAELVLHSRRRRRPGSFGNNEDTFQQWHWDGDGVITTGAGRPLALGQLSAGAHTLVVEKREAGGAESPRLDMLFLTTDPAAVPTDLDAEIALEVCPQGVCEDQKAPELCGDASGDGRLSVVDAWSILTASIGVADSCGMSVCDVDASHGLNSTDALLTLRAAVGVGLMHLTCEPTVAFDVVGANKLTSVDFTVDYSNTNVSFDVGAGGVSCSPTRPRLTAG